MKLLFDQNLSPRLVGRLADSYPNSAHVFTLGLDRAADHEIWEYALRHDYLIVSRDADYSELSVLRGFPPKVILIRRGNCSTEEIENMLRQEYNRVEALVQGATLGILLLY